MRTVLVNPRKRRNARKKRTTKRRRRRNVAITRRKKTMGNPRRRRRRVTVRRRRRRNYSAAVSNPRRRRRRRRRRRNAGIAPFVRKSNPLILQNPKRRRRRRRNPKMNIQRVANQLLIYTGGSAIAVGANILAINKIENKWARNGVRVAAAVFAPMFIKGDLGAAFAGAMLYPVVEEAAQELNLVPAEADLSSLAAELEEALNEADYDQFGYQRNPIW